MPGKLPIDRVRDALHAPRIFEQMRSRFTEKRARLSRQVPSGQDSPFSPETIARDGRNDVHEHGGMVDPEPPGAAEEIEARDRA
jgi:hypothetical protein